MTDASGSAIADAKVTVISERTGEARSRTAPKYQSMKTTIRSSIALWAFCLFLPAGAASRQSEKTIVQWARFEAQFTSAAEYQNPLQELQVEVDSNSPGGRKHTVSAFWDGF